MWSFSDENLGKQLVSDSPLPIRVSVDWLFRAWMKKRFHQQDFLVRLKIHAHVSTILSVLGPGWRYSFPPFMRKRV